MTIKPNPYNSAKLIDAPRLLYQMSNGELIEKNVIEIASRAWEDGWYACWEAIKENKEVGNATDGS